MKLLMSTLKEYHTYNNSKSSNRLLSILEVMFKKNVKVFQILILMNHFGMALNTYLTN